MRRPYVGVAAVASLEHVEFCTRYAELLPGSNAVSEHGRQVLALGFQVSSKTLRGETNKYPEIYPKVKDLPELLRETTSKLERHVHFSPTNGDNLLAELKLLSEMVGPQMEGLQINLSSPEPAVLWWWKEKYPDQRLIVPVTSRMLEECSHWPKTLAELFTHRYGDLATDVLFDLSGGRGQPLPDDLALPYLQALRDLAEGFGLGVAGGLGPLSMAPVAKLIKPLWPLSWDAQTQLCVPGLGLEEERTKLYIQASAALFLIA